MSPILVRPVREQLEHDRVIRLLQAKYKRKFEVDINPGASQAAPVGTGDAALYPDLVLLSTERSRRLVGVVEVETVESVNHLEAMAQWVRLGRLRAELHLYVPASVVDTTRRLCAEFQVTAAELWTYHAVGEEIRFTLIQKTAVAHAPEPRQAAAPKVRAAARKTPAKKAVKAKAPAAKKVAARPRLASKAKPAARKVAATKKAAARKAPAKAARKTAAAKKR